MDDPLRLTWIDALLGTSLVLAVLATAILLARYWGKSLTLGPSLLALALIWLVPLVGPALVMGIAFKNWRPSLSKMGGWRA